MKVAAIGPTPYASLRNVPIPPADGKVFASLTYEYDVMAATAAAARNASGNHFPAVTAT